MAVLFIEGFDHYVSDAALVSQIASKWDTLGQATPSAFELVSPAYARGSGQGCRLADSGGSLEKNLSGTPATLMVGCAANFTSIVASNAGSLITLSDGSGEQVSLRFDSSGHLIASTNGVTLGTSSSVLTSGQWNYIEIKVLSHGSAGTFEVRVNGSNTGWLNLTAQDTQGQSTLTFTKVKFGVGTNNNNNGVYLDDIYICDTTGSVNTSFLGPVRVSPLLPTGAGNHTDFTGNGGPNFANVQDMPMPDGDTTFNQSATASQIDSFPFTDIPEASGTIFAIQHNIYARQDAGAQRVLAPLQRSSATDYVGTSRNLSTSYKYYTEVKETNPDTSAAWTVAGVNGAEFGYKLIS